MEVQTYRIDPPWPPCPLCGGEVFIRKWLRRIPDNLVQRDPFVVEELSEIRRKLAQPRDQGFAKTLPVQVDVEHGIADTIAL
jgi:hypothetical protein